MVFESYQKARCDRIEQFLTALLPSDHPTSHNDTSQLYEAIRYSVFNGGKRIRPLLVYAAGEALGSPLEKLDAPAAAIELIHCYSLIHDDLPAMDDDDLRRGKPTCHKAFDEATAILAGDALQALAFQILSDPKLNIVTPQQQVLMIQTLAKKSGMEGMVGGQALDLISEGNHLAISLDRLRNIHQMKTGCLIEASVTLGALTSPEITLNADLITKLQEYARCIGLAFQIQDDILDVISDSQTLGKSFGKDQKQNKATFPSRLGLETAKQYANVLHQKAMEAIDFLNDQNHHLEALSEFFINRLN